MEAKDIRIIMENFHKHLKLKQELQQRMMRTNSLNSPNSEILISRIEEIENEQLVFIEAMKLLDDKSIKFRDSSMVRLRVNGRTYQSIGEVYGLTRERVRQILNELYEYIAENIKC